MLNYFTYCNPYIDKIGHKCIYDFLRPNAWQSICIIDLYDKIPHSIFYKSHYFYLILINSYHMDQFGIDTHIYHINNSRKLRPNISVQQKSVCL